MTQRKRSSSCNNNNNGRQDDDGIGSSDDETVSSEGTTKAEDASEVAEDEEAEEDDDDSTASPFEADSSPNAAGRRKVMIDYHRETDDRGDEVPKLEVSPWLFHFSPLEGLLRPPQPPQSGLWRSSFITGPVMRHLI